MTNFGEHYNEELAQQEIEINKKTLREMVGAFIVLTAVWGLAFGRFPTVNAIVFSVTYAISAGFFIASVILFFKADPSDERMKCFFVTGICIISAAMNLMFSYHMVLAYVFPLIVAVQYKEKSVLWLSYALEVFLLPVSMIVGFYYGICDLNLLLQGNHTRTWYMAELADGFAKLPFSKMPVVVIIVYGILPQLLILFVFVMIIQHTIGSMREDAYRIAELTYRKEVDSATRLYNKNKYEDMLANYYTMVERVAVVLWDINNLKEINDRMGHGMGDKLIETMSGAIYAQTDSRKKAYRIGGDEFVMLIENPEKQEAEQIIQNVRDKLARHREEGGLRVSSATGTAEGNGIDILKIVHDADERMYEDKKRGKESREYAMFYSE